MWSPTTNAQNSLQRRTTRDERAKFFESAPLSPTGRLLLADRRAPLEHFWPKNLLLSAAHAVAFTAAPALAAATPGPDADDEDELMDWKRLEEELQGFRGRSLAMMVRVLGCTSLKRVLEALCVRHCSAATADWLLKDAAKSARRKALRYGRVPAARRMLETAAYANALGYFSNWAVEQGIFCAQYIRECRREPDKEVSHRHKLRKQTWNGLVGYGCA
eukprot:CAMPEP_0119283968 /NCGR_PEP_ID=MMETSP1329-20130426/29536_1 /TAXON_ID=114041 /ORGANISM="Genus nov. species nov., Strain RCC1024" /LENGTH=217 /DNA_ID=CAMNT_0007284643 /DNA_START=186 /DNA_END=836 /DNA_ORIENTATION=-